MTRFVLILLLSSSFSLFAQKETNKPFVVLQGELENYTREFNGEIQDVKYEEIHILDSYNFLKSIANAKVKNGKVSFKFHYDEFKLYRLTTRLGTLRKDLAFYPDADTISFSLKSNGDVNLNGGSLTNDYLNKVSEMSKKLDQKLVPIYEKFGRPNTIYENGKMTTTNPIAANKEDSVRRSFKKEFIGQKVENPKLSDLNIFLDRINLPYSLEVSDLQQVKELTNYYLTKVENNDVYSSQIKETLTNFVGHYSVKEGANYFEISADNQNNEKIELASYIGKSNYLLLDLWAPWCGPCIGKSKKVEPIYEKYNELGFEVFSVMVDEDNKEEYSKTVKKYDYPWTVLVDLNSKYNVRNIYGIQTSGGIQVLLDQHGKIIKVDPSVEELTAILKENL